MSCIANMAVDHSFPLSVGITTFIHRGNHEATALSYMADMFTAHLSVHSETAQKTPTDS